MAMSLGPCPRSGRHVALRSCARVFDRRRLHVGARRGDEPIGLLVGSFEPGAEHGDPVRDYCGLSRTSDPAT